MKRIKREIALFLTLCLVFTGAIPAYAEETNILEKSAEKTEQAAMLGDDGVTKKTVTYIMDRKGIFMVYEM